MESRKNISMIQEGPDKGLISVQPQRPCTNVQKTNALQGPARGYETGIRGLMGGEQHGKSYSVERIGYLNQTHIGNTSPYQWENQGKSRYKEHMSQETGNRVGMGVRNSQGAQTVNALVQKGNKKQYVSVWDALQLQDVDHFKEEQRKVQERTQKEKQKLRQMLSMQIHENQQNIKREQKQQEMEHQQFIDSLGTFDKKNNQRNNLMKNALHQHKTENQNHYIVRQKQQNFHKANQIIDENCKNDEEL